MITIICPRTGQRVPTGVVMDRDEFERAAALTNVFRCPACGRVHEWSKHGTEWLTEASDEDPVP